MVQYTAQPGKGAEALTALKQLLAEVKREPHYLGISLLVNPANPAAILLYEQWADADYYRGAHMQTPHLQAFIASSRAFLAAPPEISFWQTAD
jgi:quinol monooxygenase YgiN